MSTPAMHLEAASDAGRACDQCGTLFNPKRPWSRFCRTNGDACRNAFHAAEARKEAIREAAPALYAALASIAKQVDGEDGRIYGAIAAEAIKDLKPPEESKALLEKAKA